MEEFIPLVRDFFFDNFIFDTDEDILDNSASLLEQGIIDSTGVMEVAAWLEEEFDIRVKDEEIIPGNMGSVNNIAVFIAGKIQQKHENNLAATAFAGGDALSSETIS